jgi:hypothetical protein
MHYPVLRRPTIQLILGLRGSGYSAHNVVIGCRLQYYSLQTPTSYSLTQLNSSRCLWSCVPTVPRPATLVSHSLSLTRCNSFVKVGQSLHFDSSDHCLHVALCNISLALVRGEATALRASSVFSYIDCSISAAIFLCAFSVRFRALNQIRETRRD